jgi:hypothetical protein
MSVNDLDCEGSSHTRSRAPGGVLKKDAARKQDTEADERQQISLLIGVGISMTVRASRLVHRNLVSATGADHGVVSPIVPEGTASAAGCCSQLNCAERVQSSVE